MKELFAIILFSKELKQNINRTVKVQVNMDTPIECYLKAKENFHTSRPYGIRIDYSRKRFILFNRQMNILGEGTPGKIELLSLEYFDNVEDIPTEGVYKISNGNILDIFFYTDQTDPFTQTPPNLEYMKMYNQYMYPLSLLLNRSL